MDFRAELDKLGLQRPMYEAVNAAYLSLFESSTRFDANEQTSEQHDDIPSHFAPITAAQCNVDAKLKSLGIVIDWSEYMPNRARSWKSQGLPSGHAYGYSYGKTGLLHRQAVSFYASVSELAKTPAERFEIDTMYSPRYDEIAIDTLVAR